MSVSRTAACYANVVGSKTSCVKKIFVSLLSYMLHWQVVGRSNFDKGSRDLIRDSNDKME